MPGRSKEVALSGYFNDLEEHLSNDLLLAVVSAIVGLLSLYIHQKRDRYDHIVGKVWVGEVDACLEQVKTGFAWHYKKYQHEQSLEDQRLYADAENQARNERLGLWRENNPNPPWEYRRLYQSQ